WATKSRTISEPVRSVLTGDRRIKFLPDRRNLQNIQRGGRNSETYCAAVEGGGLRFANPPTTICWMPPGAAYSGASGITMLRHMWLTGVLSLPRPSFGCLKWRLITSVNSSMSTCTLGSKEYRSLVVTIRASMYHL